MSGYKIINFEGSIDAVAQFQMNIFEISFSTLGRSKGACKNPVAVFLPNSAGIHCVLVGEFDSVEDAVKWCNGDFSVMDYQNKPVSLKHVYPSGDELRLTVNKQPTLPVYYYQVVYGSRQETLNTADPNNNDVCFDAVGQEYFSKEDFGYALRAFMKRRDSDMPYRQSTAV